MFNDEDEDDEEPQRKKAKNDSLLLNLLNRPGPSSQYIPASKSGLSTLSVQTPRVKNVNPANVQRTFLPRRQNSFPASKTNPSTLPPNPSAVSNVIPTRNTQPTTTQNSSNDENILPLKLLAIVNVEFDILELLRQRSLTDVHVNHHSYYSVAVFQLGQL